MTPYTVCFSCPIHILFFSTFLLALFLIMGLIKWECCIKRALDHVIGDRPSPWPDQSSRQFLGGAASQLQFDFIAFVLYRLKTLLDYEG